MRRADRLFLLIQALRGRRTALTAQALAERLQVSVRTVYRDVADLQRSGVPIEGEAGVGYLLRHGGEIPPLMFAAEELQALLIGARLVRALTGERLGAAADRAMLRIEGALPPALRDNATEAPVFAPVLAGAGEAGRQAHAALHLAIAGRRPVRFGYRDLSGRDSERVVEPLCLVCWGPAWTLGAWCRLRGDFRNFRTDRMAGITTLDERIAPDPARGLEAFMRSVGA